MGATLNTRRKDLRGRRGGVMGKHVGSGSDRPRPPPPALGSRERSSLPFLRQGTTSIKLLPQTVVRIK